MFIIAVCDFKVMKYIVILNLVCGLDHCSPKRFLNYVANRIQLGTVGTEVYEAV